MSKQRTNKELNKEIDVLTLKLNALEKRLNRYLSAKEKKTCLTVKLI